jgi:hypothetical protein
MMLISIDILWNLEYVIFLVFHAEGGGGWEG